MQTRDFGLHISDVHVNVSDLIITISLIRFVFSLAAQMGSMFHLQVDRAVTIVTM